MLADAFHQPRSHRRRLRIAALFTLLSGAAMVSAGPSLAQVATPGLGGAGGGGGGAPGAGPAGSNASDKEAPALAPALPGAISTNDSVAPATKVAAEMSPNDALFDAIERGDQQGVRDALGRGAQIDAHDVLGETPLELAVDLGWHAIAFTLLSMRGSSGGGGLSAEEAADVSIQSRAEAKESALARLPEATPAPRAIAHLAAASGAGLIGGVSPAAFAGTPNPEAGFLGFAPLH